MKKATDLPPKRFYKKLTKSYTKLLVQEVYRSVRPTQSSEEIKENLKKLIDNISNIETEINAKMSLGIGIDRKSPTVGLMSNRVTFLLEQILREYEKMYTEIKYRFSKKING